jgi:lipase chaperone LimK
MRNRLVIAVGLLAVIVIAALWLRPGSPETTDTTPQRAAPSSQSMRSPVAAAQDSGSAIVNAPPAQPASTSTTDPTGTFRTDDTGKLIIDEQTRLNMEALFARVNPADLPKLHEEITETLPPAAAAEASALLDRYQNYSKAQRQAYPPGAAPATEEAAVAELDGLHALRIAHFGSDIAHALYGAEESLTRSLIELMRLEKDQSLTLEEKAARAQQLYDTLPELSRVQRSD